MDRSERDAWLLLLRTPGLGPARLRRALAMHRSAGAVVDALRRGAVDGIDDNARDWVRQPDDARLAADIEWLADPAHALVTFVDDDFPPLLADVPGAPAALFVVGDVTRLWLPQIAIVGSRSASQAGIANARAFSKAFAEAGFAITSGLALGIDGAAHGAALDAGGMTIAVLGTGPDCIYPRSQHALAARIADGHALVSEFPPGTTARPEFFPRRNRIIAGLALGTLVVEAGVQSGSLITARYATEQGRDVFAIPGSIHNPLARGCHRLIRDGARLVETADDVLSELAPLAGELAGRLRERLRVVDPPAVASESAAPATGERDGDYVRLLDALGDDPAAIDVLADRTGLPVPALSSMLFVLELEGDVVAAPGGRYARRVR